MHNPFRLGSSIDPDPWRAVRELHEAIGLAEPATVLFFCSPRYDLTVLGEALRETFPGPVIGCTSSGQIGPAGYQPQGIVAVSAPTASMGSRTWAIRDLQSRFAGVWDGAPPELEELISETRVHLARTRASRSFGFILVDGLAKVEEPLAAALYQAVGAIPIVGGSAGDDLAFAHTHVYLDGRFEENAASFTIFDTDLPIEVLKFQHFKPTSRKLVITRADLPSRTVLEINGEPAALAYAEALGLSPADLNATVYSRNPVMLRIGDDWYVRSIAMANPDLSLSFFCAIEEGLVLSIGEGVDTVATVQAAMAGTRERIGEPALLIACDCILRRLELEERGLDGNVGSMLAANRAIGFSTYGEQFNGVHINQTFTGIAIGGPT